MTVWGTLRVVLDEAAFRELVAGRVAKVEAGMFDKTPIEIILADIGWARMLVAVEDAMRAQGAAA
jgi:hypothetical protein